MKNSVLLSFLASIFVIGACAKTNVEPLVLVSVSAETFTHEGGIGCAEFNLKDISVVSSQPDWLKVQTFESTVLFNVYSNSTYEPRTGSITVSAMGAGSVVLNITQQQFSGLYVTTETLNFSDQSLQ